MSRSKRVLCAVALATLTLGALLADSSPAAAHIRGNCGAGYKLAESVRKGGAQLDLYVRRGTYCALTRHVGWSYGKRLPTTVEVYQAQGPYNAVPIYHDQNRRRAGKQSYDAGNYRYYAGPVYFTPRRPTADEPRSCVAAVGRVKQNEVFTTAHCWISV